MKRRPEIKTAEPLGPVTSSQPSKLSGKSYKENAHLKHVQRHVRQADQESPSGAGPIDPKGTGYNK